MAQRTRPSPLIVARVVDQAARKALRDTDAELQVVDSPAAILKTEYQQPPGLFVIQVSSSGELDSTQKLLESLRHHRPLTDVLIWSPRASGSTVRALFRGGAKDVIVSPSTTALLRCVQQTLDDQQLLPSLNELSRKRSTTARFESMLSRSESMWDLFELCTRIAPTDATTMIVGETGTGKELMARAVHRRSRRQGRFVAANCASVPPELINSELFGHEKGAFTGADRAKKGLVMHADGGTLFLDEIGDMPAEGQQSLLRMLQERRIRPVGSLVEAEVDVRVVAATNVPLDQAVREGRFREDLFYRLDVIRMNVPPLRERPEDILFLFGHFTKQLSRHYGTDALSYSDRFIEALTQYEWPGNVRQLQNLSERLVLSRPGRLLTARDFAKLRHSGGASQAPPKAVDHKASAPQGVDTSLTLEANVSTAIASLEQEYLTAVLRQSSGVIGAAAKRAGISRRTLLRKLKAYGIDKDAFKPE